MKSKGLEWLLRKKNGIQLMQLTAASIVPYAIDYSLCEKLLMNNS